jgi:ubiquinone/menaquinone biosynthesis C-methylase UbiE
VGPLRSIREEILADGREVAVWDKHAQECREADRVPFTFDIDDKGMGGWLRSKVLECSNGSSRFKVVDVGCGPSYWINLFEGAEYTGFDQSSGMLELCKEVSPNSNFVLGNARNLKDSFSANTFDMVFTAAVLQHNRHDPDKIEILDGFYHILKPGGYYLFTENTFKADNCPQSIGNAGYTDGYSFTVDGWINFLGSNGFSFQDSYKEGTAYLFRKVK